MISRRNTKKVQGEIIDFMVFFGWVGSGFLSVMVESSSIFWGQLRSTCQTWGGKARVKGGALSKLRGLCVELCSLFSGLVIASA